MHLCMLATMSTTTSINHLLLFCSLLLLLSLPASPLNLDGALLLSLKYSILSDPLSVLDNWDYNDETPCLWSGITCAQAVNVYGFPETMRVVSLSLPNSKLAGNIPEDLGLIPHLKTLDLSHNFFNGTLPLSLFNASQLQVLDLSGNAISGSVPELAAVSSLSVVNLSENEFVGKVPLSIATSRNLAVVSLRRNYLSGRIPSGIQSLQVLDLSSNSLNGTLPAEFGGLNLRYLNLSSNHLSGSVPPTFASEIPANATVDISFNHLSGEIPATIPLLSQGTEAYAGNADLCGKPLIKLCAIPSTLSPPPNVTSNTTSSSSSSSPAIAAIPEAETIGSTSSAAKIQHGLNPGAVAGIAVVPLAAVGVLAALFLYTYQKKKKNGASNAEKLEKTIQTASAYEFKKYSEATRSIPTWPCLAITNGEETSEAGGSDSDVDNQKQQTDNQFKNERSLVMVDGESELDVETLFKASAYVLGSSGAAVVYKAVLQDGTAFAVRRVGESGGGGGGRIKEFEHEVKAIAKLRHPNLVRVRGLYWGEDEKLVICDYVSNGSLANIGCRKIGSSPYHLSFLTRLKIARGVARGLTYIHNKKNVHGNIKPSNILLTAEMEPLITDLGLHRLLHRKPDGPARHFGSKRYASSDTGIGFVGCTSPYHAPESFNNLKPNPKWDVYSFGVLMLELLTGKVFSDRELSQWSAGSVAEDPARVLRMVDVAIRGDVAAREEAMLAWFKLGFSCASLNPRKRPCMRDALHLLETNPLFF